MVQSSIFVRNFQEYFTHPHSYCMMQSSIFVRLLRFPGILKNPYRYCMVQTFIFERLLKFSGILYTSICIIHIIPIGIVWCNLQDKQDLLIPDSGC